MLTLLLGRSQRMAGKIKAIENNGDCGGGGISQAKPKR